MSKSSKNKSKSNATEADFEAAIRGVIQSVFHGLAPDEIKHQKRFKITLGHKQYTIEANSKAWAAGKSDIELRKGSNPLAILELKKAGISLNAGDERQALSYARLMEPWPPLVVLSNGKDTKLFETFSGKPWKVENANDAELQALIEKGAEIAASDKRNAVEVLLGPGPGIWKSVVKDMTTSALEHMTGDLSDFTAPFASTLLFERRATDTLKEKIRSGAGVPFLLGAPLAGKSSVLRELALKPDDDLCVLLIDMASSAHGIFQSIANALGQKVGWDVTTDQVKSWLKRLSRDKKGPKLVLAVDGGLAQTIKAEVDELTSETYETNICVVIAVDRASYTYLTDAPGGRQRTRLGRRAIPIEVGPLDDEEFERAARSLDAIRIAFSTGSQKSSKLRTPWILRSIAAQIVQDPHYGDASRQGVIPSVPSLQILRLARERFGPNDTLPAKYAQIAEAVIEDISSAKNSQTFALESSVAYMCRRSTAERIAGTDVVRQLIDDDYLHETVLPGDELVLVPQVPDLFAANLGTALCRRLSDEVEDDAERAADLLIDLAGRLPFGEVISAQAIFDIAIARGGLALEFINTLLDRPPREEAVSPGTRVAMVTRPGVHVQLEFRRDGGVTVTSPDGRRFDLESDPDDLPTVKVDFMAWLILSHMVSHQIMVVNENGNHLGWIDSGIMIRVASTPHALLSPTDWAQRSLKLHDVNGAEIVCRDEGIVEPITHSIFDALAQDRERADYIVDEAVRSGSLPFLSRVDIALRRLTGSHNQALANWARRMIRERIRPAIAGTAIDH